MTTISPTPTTEMNVPLMRRVAELLVSYGDAYRNLRIDARDSTVTLTGRVADEDTHRQALSLVRSTAGVKQVVDRMIVPATRKAYATAESSFDAATPKESLLQRYPTLHAVALGVVMAAAGYHGWSLYAASQSQSVAAVAAPRPVVRPAAGTVLYDGKPAAGARLVFHPLANLDGERRRAYAVAGPDGVFRLGTFAAADGVVPGSYAVTVEWTPVESVRDPRKEELVGANLAPKRYHRPDSTPLRVRIEPAAQSARLPPLHITRS